TASTGRPIRRNRHVADLARHSDHAMPQLAMKNETAAHARSQRHHADAIGIAPGAYPFLSNGGAIGVVLKDHRCPQLSLDLRFGRIIVPAWQIGSCMDHSPFHINDSGNGEWS